MNKYKTIIDSVKNNFISVYNKNDYAFFVGRTTDHNMIYYYYNLETLSIEKISIFIQKYNNMKKDYLTLRMKLPKKNTKHFLFKKASEQALKLREKKELFRFNNFEFFNEEILKTIPFDSEEKLLQHKYLHYQEIEKQLIAFLLFEEGLSYEKIIENYEEFINLEKYDSVNKFKRQYYN